MDISYLYLIDSGNLTDMLSSETEKAFDDDIGEVKMNTIGENIRKYRKEKGLTIKQLGELCNISESNLGNYERGFRSPKIGTLTKIARALDIPLLTLMGYGRLIDDINKIQSERVEITRHADHIDALLDDIYGILEDMGNPDEEEEINGREEKGNEGSICKDGSERLQRDA